MDILYVKALHIVFVVSWFAALFYMVRLFIYTAEAQTKEENEKNILTKQLLFMQKRLWYIIGYPAMIGTLVFGLWLIYLNPFLLTQSWFLLKLILVALLFVYHTQCQRMLMQQSKGIFKWGSFKLRMFNELATVFLVGIVFLVVTKSNSGFLTGILGLIGFGLVLMLAVTLYRNSRNKKADS
ncbi:MAG: CopD family protein [Bacteroidetes bacterium]|nr:CopD family protein [Bacteroidota bacterium]